MTAADGGASRLEIRSDRLFLIEGRDEFNLFDALLKHCLGTAGRQDIQIIEAGGRHNFRHGILAIKAEAASHAPLCSLGVIRDADDDAQGAFQSVCDALRHAGYEPPAAHGRVSAGDPPVGVFILPDGRAREPSRLFAGVPSPVTKPSGVSKPISTACRTKALCSPGTKTRPSPMPGSPPGRTPWRAWAKGRDRARGISIPRLSQTCPISSGGSSRPPPKPAGAPPAPPSRVRCRGRGGRGRGRSRPRPSAALP